MQHTLFVHVFLVCSTVCLLVHAGKDDVPGPLLGVTFHHGKTSFSSSSSSAPPANVYLYTLKGDAVKGTTKGVPQHLVSDSAAKKVDLENLRALVTIQGGDVLIANSKTANSVITRYTPFCHKNGTIPDHGGVASVWTDSSLLDHPYDIAFNPATSKFYVSNQNSNNIVEIDVDRATMNVVSVAKFADCVGGATPRGVAVDTKRSLLWVSLDDANAVSIYNATNKYLVKTINLTYPIAVRYDSARDVMLVSNRDKSNSVIYVINPETFQIINQIGASGKTYDHGSGLALDPSTGVWYALSRNSNSLFAVDVDGGKMTLLSSKLLDLPEQVGLLFC